MQVQTRVLLLGVRGSLGFGASRNTAVGLPGCMLPLPNQHLLDPCTLVMRTSCYDHMWLPGGTCRRGCPTYRDVFRALQGGCQFPVVYGGSSTSRLRVATGHRSPASSVKSFQTAQAKLNTDPSMATRPSPTVQNLMYHHAGAY